MVFMCSHNFTIEWICRYNNLGSGPATPVLNGSVFFQNRNKIPINKSVSVTFGLVRLVILSYD